MALHHRMQNGAPRRGGGATPRLAGKGTILSTTRSPAAL